jgi:hypothetical protein
MIEHERRYDGDDHGTRIALLEQSTKAIKDQLKDINGNINKLVWLVFTALILAVLKFMISGNMA